MIYIYSPSKTFPTQAVLAYIIVPLLARRSVHVDCPREEKQIGEESVKLMDSLVGLLGEHINDCLGWVWSEMDVLEARVSWGAVCCVLCAVCCVLCALISPFIRSFSSPLLSSPLLSSPLLSSPLLSSPLLSSPLLSSPRLYAQRAPLEAALRVRHILAARTGTTTATATASASASASATASATAQAIGLPGSESVGCVLGDDAVASLTAHRSSLLSVVSAACRLGHVVCWDREYNLETFVRQVSEFVCLFVLLFSLSHSTYF